MSVGLEGTWVWGQWDTHAAIHGIWVATSVVSAYCSNFVPLTQVRALCNSWLVCSMVA